MSEERKLYMYVYRMILTLIYNGTYKFNDKLPSTSSLCDTYHVGRNTLRSALALLQEDSYISLQKGTHAIVTFDIHNLHHNQAYRQTLKNARTMTLEVYDTMEVILPEFFIYCFKKEAVYAMRLLLKDFIPQNIHNETELITAMYQIYLCAFEQYGNPILLDLIYTLLSYSYQPVVVEKQTQSNIRRDVNGIRKGASLIVNLASLKKNTLVKKLVQLMVSKHGENSIRNIDELCLDLKVQDQTTFVWICNRDNDFLYANVVIDIVTQIAIATYQAQEALPSIQALSTLYQVSPRTIRKALDILRQLDVIETINGIGSIVKRNQFSDEDIIFRHEIVYRNLKIYAYALEIIQVILKKITVDILKTASKQELTSLAIAIETQKAKSLEPFTTFIFQHCNVCLNIIYEELLKSLRWRIFVNMVGDKDAYEKLRKALIIALQEGNVEQSVDICMRILEKDKKDIQVILEKNK